MSLLAVLFALAGSITTHAQSHLLKLDGVLLSVDASGFIYDLGNRVDPAQVKARGKNWLAEKSGALITIDSAGLVNRRTDVRVPRTLRAHGGTWFLGERGELSVVTASGAVVTTQEPTLREGDIAPRGGNFFVWRPRRGGAPVLYTFNSATGESYHSDAEYVRRLGIDMSSFKGNGNNWLVDGRGILHVVTRIGAVMPRRDLGTFFGLSTRGGNYFVDATGATQVVMDNGSVHMPYLPLDYSAIATAGDTFGWNTRGDFFTFVETLSDSDYARVGTPQGLSAIILVRQPTNIQPDVRELVR
jgi:hypothetical protein